MKDTVWLCEETDTLNYIDQRKLPYDEIYRSASDARQVWDAIKTLAIRGAPAIGVGAAIGLYAAAVRFEDTSLEGFLYSLDKTAEMLKSARPTAVNLSWALMRMVNAARHASDGSIESALAELKAECRAIRDEDVASSKAIGENGLTLLKNGMTLLTHCNAGALATVKYGTALAPMHVGREKGIDFKVYADETRPLLQGARLTAYELARDDIDVTVICDSMAASLMAEGKIDAVLVGCDRAAANGDVANKVGTLPLAVCAKRFAVPFYVCLPFSTIDAGTPDGSHIVIEERSEDEICREGFARSLKIRGVKYYNKAFDVTPAELITAYVTEKGCFSPSELTRLIKSE